jgi:hypothetical protein
MVSYPRRLQSGHFTCYLNRTYHVLTTHCHQAGEYELGWFVRTKKRQLPPRADERDRAKFAKARSYMVRRDDLVGCKNPRCRKRFEVSGVQSVAFLDEQVSQERVH